MVKRQQGATVRDVHTLFNMGVIGDLTDAQLLERFTSRRDETAELAFAALVARHGPMVLRVCRAILRDSHDAHDAFQATFLVLVQRAGSLWVRDSLGPWIHKVALRTASYARSAATLRRRHEFEAARMAVGPAGKGGVRDDFAEVLHEEVGRLPENFRAAVVLCLLEGLTHEQAARRLGWPVGTVQSRLARGRERLRGRLTRRGFAPASEGVSAVLAAIKSAPAEVPTGLVGTTVEAAVRTATVRRLGAGTVSATIASLTEEVSNAMFISRLKMTAAALLVLGGLLTGAGVLAQQQKTRLQETRPSQQVGLSAEDFAEVKTLKEAVEVVKRALIRDGKAEYTPLLSEERVREAVRTGIRSYEAHLDKLEQRYPGSKEDFIGTTKPVLMKVVQEGAWPPGCSFFSFYRLGGTSGEYDGFWLRLQVGTPKVATPKSKGFSMPILDMAYGRFEF